MWGRGGGWGGSSNDIVVCACHSCVAALSHGARMLAAILGVIMCGSVRGPSLCLQQCCVIVGLLCIAAAAAAAGAANKARLSART
jgi:uncharacterized membrane protein